MSIRLALLLLGFSQTLTAEVLPPKAQQKAHELKSHGITRQDPYYWLRERENKELIQHLKAENQYADAMLAKTKVLQAKLFEEFKSRVSKVEESAPFPYRGYLHYSRQLEEQNYPVFYRKKIDGSGTEELVLDVNEKAKGHATFLVSNISFSPDDRYFAYAVDTEGSLSHTIHVLDRKSRKSVLSIPDATGQYAWSEDSKTLVFTVFDKKRMNSKWVYRQTIGQKKKQMVYEEKDPQFYVYLSESGNQKAIFINAVATTNNEVYVLDTRDLKKKPQLFLKRSKDLRYELEDAEDRYYILTNHNAKNYQLMEAFKGKTDLAQWKTVLAPDPDSLRMEMTLTREKIVIEERKDNNPVIRIIDRKDGQSRFVTFPDKDFMAAGFANYEYDAKSFLYRYESLLRPSGVYAYNYASGEQTLVKEKEVPNFQRDLYTAERLSAKTKDGVHVPISLVYKKGLAKDGKNPVLIYGYGSYGINSEPRFNPKIFSYLDRGFVYAIVNPRGSSMLGFQWYEDGKLLKKKNTFSDFIEASEFLIAEKYADPKLVFANGYSAGGLLMGAITNMRPDLYRGIVAQAPFLDVLTDMEDPSLPLVTEEYQEWGNPAEKEYYDYIKSYSPYDNIAKTAYPSIYLSGNYNDTQVMYWEPTKYAQKVRDNNTGSRSILLRVRMDSGHAGSSGRYDSLKEYAEVAAFILGVKDGLIP